MKFIITLAVSLVAAALESDLGIGDVCYSSSQKVERYDDCPPGSLCLVPEGRMPDPFVCLEYTECQTDYDCPRSSFCNQYPKTGERNGCSADLRVCTAKTLEGGECLEAVEDGQCLGFLCVDNMFCKPSGNYHVCQPLALCETSCGTMVQHGWSGQGDGSDHCKECACHDGLYECSGDDCAVRSPMCLKEGDLCRGVNVEDRSFDCPERTVCLTIGNTTAICQMVSPCNDHSDCDAHLQYCRSVRTGIHQCSEAQKVCIPFRWQNDACDLRSEGPNALPDCELDICGGTFECVADTDAGTSGICVGSEHNGASCKTFCGRTIPDGWDGPNDGMEYCNLCHCENGTLTCRTHTTCPTRYNYKTCLNTTDLCYGENEGDLIERADECPDDTYCVSFNSGSLNMFCMPSQLCEADDECRPGEWCRSYLHRDGLDSGGCGEKICTRLVSAGGYCTTTLDDIPACMVEKCRHDTGLYCVSIEDNEDQYAGKCLKARPCKTFCGRVVDHGYQGPDDGYNYCNDVMCNDGKMIHSTIDACTKRSPVCLQTGLICKSASVDREDQCPDGTTCQDSAADEKICTGDAARVLCESNDDCGMGQWCQPKKANDGSCSGLAECTLRVDEGEVCHNSGLACEIDICQPFFACVSDSADGTSSDGKCVKLSSPCTTPVCARTLPSGWSGKGIDGDDYCNDCMCEDGVYSCQTQLICDQRTPTCLGVGSQCLNVDAMIWRQNECPTGMVCTATSSNRVKYCEPESSQMSCNDDADCSFTEWCRPGKSEDGQTCDESKSCVARVGEDSQCGGSTYLCFREVCLPDLTCEANADFSLEGMCKPRSTGVKPCVKFCGMRVPHGWNGMDDGNNHCNSCSCNDGVKTCSSGICEARATVCLGIDDTCWTPDEDRSNECPEGALCEQKSDAGERKYCLMRECRSDADCPVNQWCQRIMNSAAECGESTVCSRELGEGSSCVGVNLACPTERCGFGLECMRMSSGIPSCANRSSACKTECGRYVADGSRTYEDGANYCNEYTCEDGNLIATETTECLPRTPKCLSEEDICRQPNASASLDRSTECPASTVCRAKDGDLQLDASAGLTHYCLPMAGCEHDNDCGYRGWCKPLAIDGECGKVRVCSRTLPSGSLCGGALLTCPQEQCEDGLTCLSGSAPTCGEQDPNLGVGVHPTAGQYPSIAFVVTPLLLALSVGVLTAYVAKKRRAQGFNHLRDQL
ncbi:hypothetical protein DIPPA_14447 [Diplonema papillatum]|nr:hypothetical protein DIPPA_14447 [Diplonema papillatum]